MSDCHRGTVIVAEAITSVLPDGREARTGSMPSPSDAMASSNTLTANDNRAEREGARCAIHPRSQMIASVSLPTEGWLRNHALSHRCQ